MLNLELLNDLLIEARFAVNANLPSRGRMYLTGALAVIRPFKGDYRDVKVMYADLNVLIDGLRSRWCVELKKWALEGIDEVISESEDFLACRRRAA